MRRPFAWSAPLGRPSLPSTPKTYPLDTTGTGAPGTGDGSAPEETSAAQILLAKLQHSNEGGAESRAESRAAELSGARGGADRAWGRADLPVVLLMFFGGGGRPLDLQCNSSKV